MSCSKELLKQLSFIPDTCVEDGISGTGKNSGMRMHFALNTPSKGNICCIDMDCVKSELGNRHTTEICDYVFYHCTKNDYHFVELKSPADWEKGFNQIVETIKLLKGKTTISKNNVYAYLVCSKSIPKAQTKLNSLKEKFKKEHGVKFQKIGNNATVAINS